MTKKQKLRRNSFTADLNTKEDDFILADLEVMLDEEETSPVPLNHFLDDEETIDRLLVTTGFDVNDEPDTMAIDDFDLADDFPDFDQFAIKPVGQAGQNLPTETRKTQVSDIHSMADFDEISTEEDAIDRLLVDAGFDADDELEQGDGELDDGLADEGLLFDADFDANDELEQGDEKQSAMDADTDMFDLEESEAVLDNAFLAKEKKPETAPDNLETTGVYPFGTERENINDHENKAKKAAIITYAALGFGIVALLSTVVMGVMLSNVQTKVSKLSDLVSILEEDMGSVAGKNSDLEISNSDSPSEQLNQKVNGFPERLEEQTRYSQDILENGTVADVTKQATVNKPPVPENKKPPEAIVKKVSAEKKAQVVMKQPQSSSDVSKNKITTVAKKQAVVNKPIDKLQTQIPKVEKKKPSEAAVKKQAAASWSVDLTAYKDLADAKSKAAKLSQKGIPVKVMAVNMNNTKWYRLKVGGFKSKEEATSYAAKIKKSLNLNSVSVGNH